jgi:hypothetical protein
VFTETDSIRVDKILQETFVSLFGKMIHILFSKDVNFKIYDKLDIQFCLCDFAKRLDKGRNGGRTPRS